MIWNLINCVDWCHIESQPENSGHPVRLFASTCVVFNVAAPSLWNRLPVDSRNVSSLKKFKLVLKIHKSKVAFTDK